MNTEASYPNASGESDGFSRLDLVKHSVMTVIEVLELEDQICLITFSDDDKLKIDFIHIHDHGKALAIQVLESLRIEGMTNIWDGLRVGLLKLVPVLMDIFQIVQWLVMYLLTIYPNVLSTYLSNSKLQVLSNGKVLR